MTDRIADVRITPIAFRDPPLLNVAGVHQPWALRSIIEVETESGRIGLGESYGEADTLADLQRIAPTLVGLDPFHLDALTQAVYRQVGGDPDIGAPFPVQGDKARASALGAFEVAFWDLQGQITGRPVHDLLGGAVRQRSATAPTCSTSTPGATPTPVTRLTPGRSAWTPTNWWPRPGAWLSCMALAPSSSRQACSSRRWRWRASGPCARLSPTTPCASTPTAAGQWPPPGA